MTGIGQQHKSEWLAALREQIVNLERMRRHLTYSRSKIASWWQAGIEFDRLDEEKLESLAAFKARFAELQDHLSSAMRLIARIEGEDTTRFTYVLSYMTQLAILDDMEKWQVVRELRNAAAHDYAADDAVKIRHFDQLLQHTPYLLETLDRLQRFVAVTYPVPSEKE